MNKTDEDRVREAEEWYVKKLLGKTLSYNTVMEKFGHIDIEAEKK